MLRPETPRDSVDLPPGTPASRVILSPGPREVKRLSGTIDLVTTRPDRPRDQGADTTTVVGLASQFQGSEPTTSTTVNRTLVIRWVAGAVRY